MNEEEKNEFTKLNLEIAILSTDVAKLRNALGELVTWQRNDIGGAKTKQLLEMIE